MRRREFITLFAGPVTAWPVGAWAQRASMPVIGLVGSGTAETNSTLLDAFRKGLRTTNYVDGQNVKIEYRWAAGNYEQVPALLSDLLHLAVNVIVVFDNTAIAVAAKEATKTTPVVFAIGTDPVKFGLVSTLSRPDANITGVTALTVGLGVKRLQVLRELLPNARKLSLLVNPKNPATKPESEDVVSAGKASHTEISILNASTTAELDAAFLSAAEERVAGLLIQSDLPLNVHPAAVRASANVTPFGAVSVPA